MQQYYQVNLFDPHGRFQQGEIKKIVDMGRRHFFIYFPRVVRLEEVVKLANFCSQFEGIRFCIHDKTLITTENEVFIGRNISFYYMLKRLDIQIENISFHLGSLFGFGGSAQANLLTSIIGLELNQLKSRERFFCTMYDEKDYQKHLDTSLSYLKNIVSIAEEFNIKILLKNLCLDYIVVDKKKRAYFEDEGYKLDQINEHVSTVPKLLDKGDFPRNAKDMLDLERQYDIGFALDLEYLRYTVLMSKRFNLHNKAMMEVWDISLNNENKKMIDELGFIISKGKPIFYENEIDIYDQIFMLKNKVHIAHLSGSIGPVFLDKKLLNQEDINNSLLLGILKKEDIPFAIKGKNQLSTFDGFNDEVNERNFRYDAPQRIWEEIFKKQFLEDVYLLKEIGCKRIVQKMKGISENAIQTFEMFNNITDIDMENSLSETN